MSARATDDGHSPSEPIGVIGAGWVGLVTAACFAELGHEVYCRDILAAKVESLSRGEVPIHEPGLAELVARNAERLHFTTEMADVLPNASLLFCCVDTPPTYSGDADLSRVERVLEELGDSPDHALVMKSTVPVGTGRSIGRRAPTDLGYVSNPEFLKEGTAVEDFMGPERVVVGADAAAEAFGDRVEALYAPLRAPVVRTDVASAEMIKLASNAFLATKISFINEIANVSEELGADVLEVARGMGLDSRIGPKFLQAGIGYGGSCLLAEETVLTRVDGRVDLTSLAELFERAATQQGLAAEEETQIAPDGLEVLSWEQDDRAPRFRRVEVLTRRPYDGDVLEVRTKMGRRVRCTPDHPFLATDAAGGSLGRKLAEDLTSEDWLPLAQGSTGSEPPQSRPLALETLAGAAATGLVDRDVILRPPRAHIDRLASANASVRATALEHPRGSLTRIHDIVRSGAMRLDEARTLDVPVDDATVATARNGSEIPTSIIADESFWRVVGLYLAEGHCTVDGERGSRHRLQWSFHPTKESDLVDEVAGFWRRHGTKADVRTFPTTTAVVVSSRILAGWWIEILGLGRNCYRQRVPDLIWSQPDVAKRALLSGLWHGDGSWSYVSGGPSVVLEWGSASRVLADGVLRLLGDLGLAARWKVGRTAKSTQDNHWIVLAGAEQVERALFLVPQAERGAVRDSLSHQAKRIAPTGYRRCEDGSAWVRVTSVTRRSFTGPVFSMEVPGPQTFVTTGGLVTHNCFPKDVSALKQLAGNSGYHFQLLTAVIEVNELQKRRTIGKLQKHLGSLVGREIALLGVAFKPNTDDVREATALVLAARLQGEGAQVRVYDPVAAANAADMLGGARLCDSAIDALDGADAAVLVTEWPEFGQLDWSGAVKDRMAGAVVVDGRNFLDGEALRAAGFLYEGVGRSVAGPPREAHPVAAPRY